jgi:hypothetical protein
MNTQLTDKFVKELEKFCDWANKNNYIITDRDNNQQIWNIDLLNNFNEPNRNKLEIYIKSIREIYNIEYNNDTVNDAKLLVKEYKNSPKEKVVKEPKEKVVKEPKEPKETKEIKEKVKKDVKMKEIKEKVKKDVKMKEKVVKEPKEKVVKEPKEKVVKEKEPKEKEPKEKVVKEKVVKELKDVKMKEIKEKVKKDVKMKEIKAKVVKEPKEKDIKNQNDNTELKEMMKDLDINDIDDIDFTEEFKKLELDISGLEIIKS